MELIIEVVGVKAFKDVINGETINSGAFYAEVKLDERYNTPGKNVKRGKTTEEWKVPADIIFAFDKYPTPFLAVLEVERVSNGKETKEIVVSARPHESAISQRQALEKK